VAKQCRGLRAVHADRVKNRKYFKSTWSFFHLVSFTYLVWPVEQDSGV